MTHPSNVSSRRGFLKSANALIALPFLESFGFRQFASAASPIAPPKRAIFLGMGFGVTRESWYPDVNTVGADYEMPKVLEPLQKHQKDITIIQNLYHQYSNDGHSGSTFWLTGANRYAIPGQSFHNTVGQGYAFHISSVSEREFRWCGRKSWARLVACLESTR